MLYEWSLQCYLATNRLNKNTLRNTIILTFNWEYVSPGPIALMGFLSYKSKAEDTGEMKGLGFSGKHSQVMHSKQLVTNSSEFQYLNLNNKAFTVLKHRFYLRIIQISELGTWWIQCNPIKITHSSSLQVSVKCQIVHNHLQSNNDVLSF